MSLIFMHGARVLEKTNIVPWLKTEPTQKQQAEGSIQVPTMERWALEAVGKPGGVQASSSVCKLVFPGCQHTQACRDSVRKCLVTYGNGTVDSWGRFPNPLSRGEDRTITFLSWTENKGRHLHSNTAVPFLIIKELSRLCFDFIKIIPKHYF